MTLPELYERIGSLPSGGYLTVDTRFDKGYIYSLIHTARAFIVSERWKQNGLIPPVYYQTFKPYYVILSQDQDTCYSRFYNVPDIISLDGRATGLGYVGANGQLCQFREVNNRAQMASMMNNRIIRKMRKPMVLVLGGGEIEVYSNDSIENMRMEAIFADPTKVPSYNVDFDQYPIEASDISKIELYILQGSMNMITRTPMDRINEQRDTTIPPQIRM
jgi:hypothetical protein